MIRKINFPITEIPYWYVNFNEEVLYEFTIGEKVSLALIKH
jgi:hypothetical protein